MNRQFAAVLSLSLALSAISANATVRWSPEDAARAKANRDPAESRRSVPAAQSKTADYVSDFYGAVWFVASMQVTDTLDAEYGGIREAEHQPSIVQTDNTSESIWMFSRYYELTGDATILPYLERSWIYVNNNKAYQEEGGTGTYDGYYRYYNCGWALRGGMKYEEVFGDTTHHAYLAACAGYLSDNTLSRLGFVDLYDNVNPPVLAWAAGNLRAFGEAHNDSTWKYHGWKRGSRVKGWVEGDPDILNTEEWAMSHGAVIWGLLESYFKEYPLEESLWVATYIPAFYDTVADPNEWENAHQNWIALGDARLEESTGDPIWGTRHNAMADYLLAFDDTDQDGGIYAQPSDTDNMDHAWITSYLGFMSLNPLVSTMTEVADGTPPLAEKTLLHRNRPNPFNPKTEISFVLEEGSRVTVEVFNPAGRLVQTLMDGDLARGAHTVFWDGMNSAGGRSPSGVYFYSLRSGDARETRKMLLIR